MKLSEAGLLGGIATEQGRGLLVNKDRTCFLGGALVAIGAITSTRRIIVDEQPLYNLLSKTWPILNERVMCPVRGHIDQIRTIIWHLNDTIHWTRPQIADWLQDIETQYEQDLLMPTSHEQEVAVNT